MTRLKALFWFLVLALTDCTDRDVARRVGNLLAAALVAVACAVGWRRHVR